jgi:hypothetical protein
MKTGMKSFVVGIVLLASVIFAAPAMAQASRSSNSLGVGIGTATVPFGLSLKTQIGGGLAVQVVAGVWRGYGDHWHIDDEELGVGADILVEQPSIVSGRLLALGWNYGAGAGVGFGGWGTVIGVSGVLGLEFNFVAAPFDFVVEYRPGIYLGSGFGDSDIDLALVDFTGHLRFWF